ASVLGSNARVCSANSLPEGEGREGELRRLDEGRVLGEGRDEGKFSARSLSSADMLPIILAAAKQVGRPIFFAMAIIILAFLPVFALTGPEGKLFHPLAFTKTFAMIGSTLFAVTIVPVLGSLLVLGPFHSEDRNWAMRVLWRIYE